MEEAELLKERLQAITVSLHTCAKKSLREQWLLDSTSHNAPGSASSEQQTRSLLLSIYRIEKEIEALEREEAIVSKNESFILERLRAVEKSTQDIIKVEPQPVAAATPHFPQSLTLTTNDPVHLEAPPRKTLFAMQINVNKNMRTGESTVLSTSCLPPEDLQSHPGFKVYDDGRKCVYALHTLEDSGQSGVSELSASEVEQLLKSATMHRQRNLHHNGHTSYCHQPHRLAPNHHRTGHKHNQRNGREIQRGTSFRLPQNNNHCPSHQLRRHQMSAHQLSYTPANDIPLSDYISVDEEEELLCCRLPPSSQRASPTPSPIFGEDTNYTILNAMETGEPITAVFMGFQPAADDSGQGQEFEGALKAELVIIDDDYGKETAETKQEMMNGSVGVVKERRAFLPKPPKHHAGLFNYSISFILVYSTFPVPPSTGESLKQHTYIHEPTPQ
uniref:Palmdelphin n=1 Tax=Periophthalmus magnuspinnatus TaxID=409849 RepID=A0A3B4A0X3_9GOBI